MQYVSGGGRMKARASRIPKIFCRLFAGLSNSIGFQRKNTEVSVLGYFIRLKRAGLLTLAICLISWLPTLNSTGGSVQNLGTLSLTWDASPSSDVVGYRLYYGTSSKTYTTIANVGNTNTVTVPGLVVGVTNYFAVTAYDTNGLESDFSTETNCVLSIAQTTVLTNLVTLAPVKIRTTTNHLVAISISGVPGHTYDIEATTDFHAWTVIGTVTLAGSLTSLDFVDTNSASFTSRFYRVCENQSVVTTAFTLAPVKIRTTTNHLAALSISGVSGHTYDIEATTDFHAWSVIGTVMLTGPLSTLDFVDPNSASYTSRFYRVCENQSVVTNTLAPAKLRMATNHLVAISISGVPTHSYYIEATTDFHVWTVIGNVTMPGALSTLDFVDPNSASYTSRFYRICESQ